LQSATHRTDDHKQFLSRLGYLVPLPHCTVDLLALLLQHEWQFVYVHVDVLLKPVFCSAGLIEGKG
jgi:hypothetical protein